MGFTNSLEKMIQLATGSKDPVAMSAVMDVQKELISIQEENRKLREENHELKNEKILSSELIFEDNLLYKKGNKERVYCSRCYESENKLISMHRHTLSFSTTYTYECPECKIEVDTDVPHGVDTSL